MNVQRWSVLAACFSVLVSIAGCDAPLRPATPSILRGASAVGGDWEVCPIDSLTRNQAAISPEFDVRLKEQFPPGTPETALVQALNQQGFELQRPCGSDDTIRFARFRQIGGGLFTYPMFAIAVWRVDHNQKLEWTRGMVAFTGL